VLNHPITITVDVLARVLHTTGVGEPPITLADGAVWVDPQTDAADAQRAWQALADAGLDGAAGADSGFIDTLVVLARPSVEYYGWITHDDVTFAVQASALGDEGVLAIRQGDEVRLAPADPARLAETLIACLPSVPAAQGRSMNLPLAQVRAELTTSRQDASEVAVLDPACPKPDHRASAFTQLARLPATGAGELHTAIRSRDTGRRVDAALSVGYQDTVDGRWLVQVVSGHDDDWVIAVPATPALLLARVREAHGALRR
jgi:hypothetical protein